MWRSRTLCRCGPPSFLLTLPDGNVASVVTTVDFSKNQESSSLEKRLNVILLCGLTNQTITVTIPYKGYPHKEM
jgi:hypothetical protein